uniref:DNA-directed RNA polymerase subunit beta n=1 Tax=uncultured bacterium Contig28b TaxID=1393549 RepID=W0FIB8_9BACT|nr:DNA-directed RNA polymerase, beta subunit [uncultured bacterium Contig28b]
MGKLRERMSFSRIDEVLEMPNLIEVQKNSYQRFLDTDLREVLADVSPITDYNGNLVLEFVDYSLDEPKNSIARCRERDITYAAPLKVFVRLKNKETGEIKESDVFMGDFPLMTDHGTFIINGAERVIVSQLVRSPGVYFDVALDKAGKKLYSSQIIPNRGAWLEYETDSNDVLWVRIDRARKLPITVILRALGYGTDAEIIDLMGEDERLMSTIQKGDNAKSREDGLIEIYKRQKPGEPASLESATNLFHSLFFDPKRYDLMRVGRYKYNKKLSITTRIHNHVAAEDIVNPQTGEIMVKKGDVISLASAREIQNAGVNSVQLDCEGEIRKVVGNNFVDASAYLPFDPKEAGILEMVHLPTLKEIIASVDEDQLFDAVRENVASLVPKHIIPDDIVSSVNYMLGLPYGIGSTDDIDHLGNRRLRSVGELLQNQIRIGLSRLERVVRERMSIQDSADIKPGDLINIRPVSAAIKEFFGSSQLSQFMDQPNPLAELTHKRRLSALGPGGLNRDRASFEVRDVHYSHYARICPIETPEGPNIGLIGSLATYARINEYGFIEAPYRRVDKENGRVLDEIDYMTADEEDLYKVATANEPLNEDGTFVEERITVRDKAEIIEVPVSQVDFMDVSPRQVVSVATAMVPFLENDDATRALMGSNMQRQAVPLLVPEAPVVATGMEYRAAHDSGVVILSEQDGVVDKVDANHIVIKDTFGERHEYLLTKFARSNQSTCINQHPVVSVGQKIEKGDLLADGPSTEKGEIGLGRNALIGFMTWEGYNYEDAVLLSEKLVKEDIYTSIHVEEFESEARETKLGPEEITRDIPNISDDAVKDLDEGGIVRIGAEVHAGDILVGKVTPKGETELTAEERLLRAIFGEKAREVRDTSLRVPHGEGGIVVDVKVFTRENKDELSPGVNEMVRIYIAQKRKISVGDKMAGRHGNKGVVSRILREEDMPFLPDGTPLQIVLNPLGVPSRMNLGQVLEVHLGLACRALGWHIATPVFDGATYEEILEHLELAEQKMSAPEDLNDPHVHENHFHNGKPLRLNLDDDGKALFRQGKIRVRDGRTGDYFENPVTVGIMYFLKLHHLVDDKMHARSTGPYSLVTQQPLGGKAQFGGQRFGEMEVWALEAYGAANTLQEILTVKSDDTVGRVKTYEAIIKGQNIPTPGVPESFKVLLKEMQALSLDVRVLDASHNEIEIPELDPEDMPQADTLRASAVTRRENESEPASSAAEESEEIEQAAEEAFSMSEDDLSFGAEDETIGTGDDFSLSDEDVGDLEDFSVEDLSDLNLDDDI